MMHSSCNAAVSFLCGYLTRKRTPSANTVEEAAAGGGDDINSTSDSGGRTPNVAQPESSPDEQQQPLPPPPGMHHRSNSTASCHVSKHQRSNSAAKLVSSMSMKLLGSGGGIGIGGRQCSRREKKLNHEDSVWKKTIILGEKCRVPNDEDDAVFYDEKGNRISTYHPKSHSGTLSYSRQTSNTDFSRN